MNRFHVLVFAYAVRVLREGSNNCIDDKAALWMGFRVISCDTCEEIIGIDISSTK